MQTARYSIKDLEQISGIKAHTIRIWEQRYSLLQPKRTKTNIRYYDGLDLKLVLNISMLKCNGMKISEIARLSPDEIRSKVYSICDECDDFEDQINALTLSMIELDEQRFEKIISSNALKYGFEHTMIKIIFPFFEKVGILWQTGSINPAQEHFISNLIRRKLIVAIDGQKLPTHERANRFLLFLPEGEMHEIKLLFADYLLRSRNNRVIYLGASVPYSDLAQIFNSYKPNYLLTIFTTRIFTGSKIGEYLNRLSKDFPKATILFSGIDPGGKLPSNVQEMKRLSELVDLADSNPVG